MDITQYFRLTPNITSRKAPYVAQVGEMTDDLGEAAAKGNYVALVTRLLYEAHAEHGLQMIERIFFPGDVAIRKVRERRNYIDGELTSLRALEITDPSRQLRLLNLYRAIVADLFDPYISLIVACLQLQEGTFESFIQANLGQGERNKYQYALARLAPTTLFAGYNPQVRNALSHTGSESIRHHEGRIVFRSIRRGNPPQVEVVTWTDEELLGHTLALMDFVYAIEIAINIFGLDVSDQIQANTKLNDLFFTDVADTENRLYIQQGFDERISRVYAQPKGRRAILDDISRICIDACSKRNLTISTIRLSDDYKTVVIDIPGATYDANSDNDVMGRLIEMVRYAIIAESCFRKDFDWYIITEPRSGSANWLQIKLKRQDLYDYTHEKAGLVDLVDGCTSVLNGKPISIDVDFEQLAEFELRSFDPILPRRRRE